MNKTVAFKGIINFKVESGHPDIQYVKNPDDVLKFEDTYTFDTNRFGDSKEEMIDFIKNDLCLVAGGGYSKEHISNVKFDINRV